jgi:hypothetical protein
VLDLTAAAVVDFPLRGEWRALNTPAERVPSHGTDFFGQRYALDFVRMDDSGTWLYPGGTRALLRHTFTGLPAASFHCWDEPVLSAFAGRVHALGDGWPDRARVRWPVELLRRGAAPRDALARGDYRPLAGNFVIVEGEPGIALYAHLRQGSVRVRAGQHVAAGEPLGRVGNSGNSTMPHLHFHLMDGPDPLTARGLPCAFRGYERWVDGRWEPVARGVPGPLERVHAASHPDRTP